MPQPPSQTPEPPDPGDDELLETGQEEVFSRTEVELGRIEHCATAGKAPDSAPEAKSGRG